MGAALRFSRGHEVMAHAERRRTHHRPPAASLGAMMDRWPNDEVDEDRDHIGDAAEEYDRSDQCISIHVRPLYQSGI